MPATVTIPLQPTPIQGVAAPGYGALDLRRYLGLPFREGAADSASFKVVQRAGGATMAVDVQAGDALVQGDSVTKQGLYHCVLEANLTGASEITVSTAHATLPRVDSIFLQIKDTLYDGSGLSAAQVVYAAGTATSGANRNNRLGAPAVPASALLLADIEVAAAAASVQTANISDRRRLALSKFEIADIRWSAASSPALIGWLLCDGAAISRTIYSELFAATSTTHGTGDGSTTFGKPDARGRAPVGSGTGSGLTARTVGQKFGAETHDLAVTEIPSHSHGVHASGPFTTNPGGPSNAGITQNSGTYLSDTQTAGGGNAHNNVQPSIVFHPYIYHGLAF